MKNLKTIIATVFISIALFSSCTSPSEGVVIKTNKEVQALLTEDNVLMIDVREPNELKQLAYDVDGIVNIPLSTFEAHLADIPKDKTIIVACRSGKRSLKAANILAANDYPKIINMEGGILAWENSGYPVIP